ncbi:MAG: RnfABCDGE type electron transport complex subunit G, partial [Candidatus Krumholzibacteria bacterium]|nr:RnfABCDGE type electron transport complex subunit G [Candidatus Krumholzibacteria bacterium]
VDQKTEAPIKKSLAAEKMDAMKIVMPVSDNDLVKDAVTIKDKDRQAEITFFVGKKGGVSVGAAFAVVAPNGYSGDIEMMVGVDTGGVVTGLEILKHAETPGLGSKIATPAFKGQFIGKSIKDPASWSVVKDGGTFKQITGATISSRAVTSAIANGLEFLDAHRTEVFGAPKGGAGAKPAGKKPAGSETQTGDETGCGGRP